MAGRGGGGEWTPPPNRFLKFFLKWEKLLFQTKFFAVRSLILGTSVHEKIFQTGPTVLALKLDEGRVLEGGMATTPDGLYLHIFLIMKMTFNLNKFWY